MEMRDLFCEGPSQPVRHASGPASAFLGASSMTAPLGSMALLQCASLPFSGALDSIQLTSIGTGDFETSRF